MRVCAYMCARAARVSGDMRIYAERLETTPAIKEDKMGDADIRARKGKADGTGHRWVECVRMRRVPGNSAVGIRCRHLWDNRLSDLAGA